MDIYKIFTFCAIVDYGTVSKAAEALYCSQPALSKQMASLEKEIGYPLFDRCGKKMTVNSNGQLVYQFGKYLEKDFNQLKSDLYNLNNPCSRELGFGATNSIGIYLLPPVLGDFKRHYPNIPVNFKVNFLPSIIDMLNQDAISFAMIPEDSDIINNTRYICQPFLDDEMVVVFPPNHPLSERKVVAPEELVQYPFLISQVQSATRAFILSRLTEQKIYLKNLVNMYNAETIKQSIINGLGISILSKVSVAHEVKNGFLKTAEIKGLKLVRQLYFVHKKNHILTQEELLFIHFLSPEKQ